MKTIQKILSYNLTSLEIECLYESEIVNGCGGKGGFDFDEIISENIEYIPGYKKEKKKRFFDDLKMICVEHDIDFRFQKGFYKSNFIFAKKLFQLTHWASLKYRLSVCTIAFVLLNRHGEQFYSIKK